MKKTRKTNPQLIELMEKIRSSSKQTKSKLWRAVAEILEGPRRHYAQVNLSKLSKITKPGDQVVVPGRVLGCGELKHQLTIAALGFSNPARRKIEKVGGEALSILELLERNPEGSGINLIR